MAVTTPTVYNVIDAGTLWGRKGFAAEPLDSIFENVNWLYKNYSPPLYNACINGGNATYLAPRDFYFPLSVSADSIVYRLYAYIWTSATSTVACDFYDSSTVTTGTPWGTATATTTFGAATGGRYVTLSLGAIGPTTKFGRLVFTPQVSGTPTCQVLWAMIAPDPVAIAAGIYPSGATAYDGAHLNATGSAIHTEYADRAIQTAAAILVDRRQCVFSYQQLAAGGNQISTRGDQTKRTVAVGQTDLHGQAGATFTVQCRAEDSGTATVRLIERGTSNYVEFAADDTDRTDTMTLTNSRPMFDVEVEPDAGTTVRYLVITWAPAEIVPL